MRAELLRYVEALPPLVQRQRARPRVTANLLRNDLKRLLKVKETAASRDAEFLVLLDTEIDRLQ